MQHVCPGENLPPFQLITIRFNVNSLGPNKIFTLRIARNAQWRVATPSACNTCYTQGPMKTGDGEGARVCFSLQQSVHLKLLTLLGVQESQWSRYVIVIRR